MVVTGSIVSPSYSPSRQVAPNIVHEGKFRVRDCRTGKTLASVIRGALTPDGDTAGGVLLW